MGLFLPPPGSHTGELDSRIDLRDCVKDDMESLGLSQKDAQFRNKWRRRIKAATSYLSVMLKCTLLPIGEACCTGRAGE